MKAQGWIVFLAIVFILQACGGENYVPKPRTYPKVVYPTRNYTPFDKDFCAFSFQQPTYTTVEQSTQFFGEATKHSCWFDVVFPTLNGRIYCSYSPVGKGADNSLGKLIDDSYNLVYKHTSKASAINEQSFSYPEHKVYGALFELEGSVASPYQFYATDSAQHYVRGSLYFNTSPNPDSMQPVINFVKADLVKMIETLEWN